MAVWNTGVGGWDPGQYLSQARSSLLSAQFDLILVSLYMGNDVLKREFGELPPRTPDEVHSFRFPRDLSSRELVGAWLYPINDFFETRSHLFTLAKTQAQLLRVRLGLSAAYFPAEFNTHYGKSADWVRTRDACDSIVLLATHYHTPTVFILIPHVLEVDTSQIGSTLSAYGLSRDSVDVEQPTRRLSALLAERRIEYVDALPAFRAARARGDELYGEVDSHLTPVGHQTLFAAIRPIVSTYLSRKPLVERGRGDSRVH